MTPMKSTSRFLSLGFAAALVLAEMTVTTMRAAEPIAPSNIAETVVFATSYGDTLAANLPLALPNPLELLPVLHNSFRDMAAVNRTLAAVFAARGYTLGMFYFLGRASAFDALADLAGEPPGLVGEPPL